jgi:hypothetical protein
MAVALAWIPEAADCIWEAYEADRVLDLGVFERITEIQGLTQRKELSLDRIGQTYGVPALDKGDKDDPNRVQVTYGQYLDRPLSEYSPAHLEYVRADGVASYTTFERQLKRWGPKSCGGPGLVSLADVAFLSRKQFWLQLVRNYGMRTSPENVGKLRLECEKALKKLRADAMLVGFLKPDGTRNMKAIRAHVSEAYDGHPPMTQAQKGRKSSKPFVPKISTARVTLEESGDPILESFADFGEWSAVENKDLKFLIEGTRVPIHTKFGIADTTRITSARPNLTNLRKAEGIRECFEPRPGHCFVAGDHIGMELVTFAQLCVSKLGLWDMASSINSGTDRHCLVAADILGISYAQAIARKKAGDPELDTMRNVAKIVNFGRQGFMGAKTLRLQAKTIYGIDKSLAFWQEVVGAWERTNPDGVAYLNWIKRMPADANGRGPVQIPGSGIMRMAPTICSRANTGFQALGAWIEAYVGWLLMRATHTPGNPLHNCPMVLFVHDEFVHETPIERRTAAAAELRRIMVEGAKKFLPDVQIQAEVTAMAYYSKKAKAKYLDGELQIWEG